MGGFRPKVGYTGAVTEKSRTATKHQRALSNFVERRESTPLANDLVGSVNDRDEGTVMGVGLSAIPASTNIKVDSKPAPPRTRATSHNIGRSLPSPVAKSKKSRQPKTPVSLKENMFVSEFRHLRDPMIKPAQKYNILYSTLAPKLVQKVGLIESKVQHDAVQVLQELVGGTTATDHA